MVSFTLSEGIDIELLLSSAQPAPRTLLLPWYGTGLVEETAPLSPRRDVGPPSPLHDSVPLSSPRDEVTQEPLQPLFGDDLIPPPPPSEPSSRVSASASSVEPLQRRKRIKQVARKEKSPLPPPPHVGGIALRTRSQARVPPSASVSASNRKRKASSLVSGQGKSKSVKGKGKKPVIEMVHPLRCLDHLYGLGHHLLLSLYSTFKRIWGPREDGSPLTDSARVFVAAAFNRSRSVPEDNDSYHRVPEEEFQELSSTRVFGFLHKAAILPARGAPEEKRSWRLCSVSEVESTKILIRTVTVSCSYLMCGVVSSTADTYFIEQAANLSTNIGSWQAPFQLFYVILMFYKLVMTAFLENFLAKPKHGYIVSFAGHLGTMFAVGYCAVAAAVERRRLHVVSRWDLPRWENVTTPMTVAWMIFPAVFLWVAEVMGSTELARFHRMEGPASMTRYAKCMSEAASGIGFMCGALLVYVVGKISETGEGKGWFQQTLNLSRLDRYYWVLTALGSASLVVSVIGLLFYTPKKELTQLQLKKELTPLSAEDEPVTEALVSSEP